VHRVCCGNIEVPAHAGNKEALVASYMFKFILQKKIYDEALD
jgi:hypothetical protein